jgi:DNA-binding transcriptional ArsR family regulator
MTGFFIMIGVAMSIDRRALLKSLAGIAVLLASGRVSAQSALSAAQFGALSATLTGSTPSEPADVAQMFAAFATPERRAALTKLANIVATTPASELDSALRSNGQDVLANDLVAAWYSGVVGAGKNAKLVLYTDAYVWPAMTFSKPMGVCGGVTGYWAKPPE